jgi:hypothetical protein
MLHSHIMPAGAEYEAAGHGVHAAEPFAALYVEAGHAVQAPLAPV